MVTVVPGWQLTTVADDEAVWHSSPADGGEVEVAHYAGLEPDTEYDHEGTPFRTLPRPGGELLSRVCTVNDVHFGELECGVMEGFEIGPVFRSEPGEEPYPEVMNKAAIAEIAAAEPDVVVVKGDLTTHGTLDEYETFLAHYSKEFGPKLLHVRGNHDSWLGETFAAEAPLDLSLPGVVIAVLDTAIPRGVTGRVSAEQLEWLDELGARADRPVLVFGHHHVWSPESRSRPEGYFGIHPDDSEKLVDVFARRAALVGYFAGHTHRNRVRRFAATGDVPWVEVACVKDYPGAWAEYRVYEGGILQVFRRISAPEALAWSEKTRGMFGGLYHDYAFGALSDRCFAINARG